MARAEHSIVIERPPDEVFDYFRDPSKTPDWQASLLEARQETPEPLSAGTRIREVRKFLGKRMDSLIELTAYSPGREFSYKVVSGPLPFHVQQRFEPVEGATRIDIVIEGEPGGFFKLAEPLVVRAVERELANNLTTLKDMLEAGEATG
jgi:uncharacterized membrane protein